MSEHDKSGLREGLEGAVEGVKGKVKEVAGAALGNENLRREGRAQQDKADSQREAAEKEFEAEKARTEADLEEQRQRSFGNS
ncbi:microaggregate-binding protein 1 [Nocardia stercoris]|uniref:CsbD family protein n=1 Tax=Nocardia stercoris TaxID=2483361 RepID=A0A3M2L7K1_9NOCA|nr:CsbD family protein [Nocardia stercoris]RMI33621.1 CsbD family protein [Nocardia stercoris]